MKEVTKVGKEGSQHELTVLGARDSLFCSLILLDPFSRPIDRGGNRIGGRNTLPKATELTPGEAEAVLMPKPGL